MRHPDRIRLQHMYDACVEAIEFVQGKNRKDLDSDRMLLLASLKVIEIIGEAAGRVSDETCHRFSAIPWREIVSMRNRRDSRIF
ncbi:MAG: hypothetical protein Tsb0017_11680 [Geothermobacteraceae bacterium]